MANPHISESTNGLPLFDDDFMASVRDNVKPFQGLMARYRCAMMEVETKLKVLSEQYSFEYERNPIESIKTRIKTPNSILTKAKKTGIPLTFDSIEANLLDIAGVRVICSFPADIYQMAQWLLQQDDIRLVQKKDYIKNPKPNGYRSLHLIIEVPIFLQNEKRWMKVEVQLRTIAMDFWASLEHKVHYKQDIPLDLEQEITEELIQCAQIGAQLDAKMEGIKNRILGLENGRLYHEN